MIVVKFGGTSVGDADAIRSAAAIDAELRRLGAAPGTTVRIGRAELAEEEWVKDPAARSARVNDLYKVIAEATPKRTTEEWISALEQVDVPCARLGSVADLLNDAHLREVGFFAEADHPTQGRIRVSRAPFKVDGAGSEPDKPAPELGDHTRAVLAEAGLTAEQIDKLMALGVINDRRMMGGP